MCAARIHSTISKSTAPTVKRMGVKGTRDTQEFGDLFEILRNEEITSYMRGITSNVRYATLVKSYQCP